MAIIGAGTAGLAARREVSRAGKRALLIEKGPHGTTCARVGCMPSKLLVAAAMMAHDVSRASRFGIEGTDLMRVDGVAVFDRVRRERDRFVGSVLEAVDALDPDERLEGHARFLSPTTLEVDGRIRVEANAVVLAAGSTPRIPKELEAFEDELLTSDNLFELPDLPRSVGVFGTGIIGLELGQALARLGVRTVFFSPYEAVGPFTDPAVAAAARESLGRELDLNLGFRYRVSQSADGDYDVHWREDEGEHKVFSLERLFVAAGRRPSFEGLGLQASGIELDEHGAPRFDPSTMQCGELPVFIAGDINKDRPFLHEANAEGAIAGRNAASFPDSKPHQRRVPLAIVFTDPQMAIAGARFHELDGDAIVIGEVSYANQGRAQVLDRADGLVRIYADRESGRLLGTEMFGPAVEHMGHLLAWAIQRGLAAAEVYELPFYHPVLEEGLRTAIRAICSELKVVCESHPRDLEHGPGA